LASLFGDTYHRAQAANSKEEFIKSKEAAGAATAWGSSLVGGALQSYAVGALIIQTGTLSTKGAAYLGSLLFLASSVPTVRFLPYLDLMMSLVQIIQVKSVLILFNAQFISHVFTEKRPLDTVAVGALARVFETVGLSVFLNWWGVRSNPFD
jgi:hypothetical protein